MSTFLVFPSLHPLKSRSLREYRDGSEIRQLEDRYGVRRKGEFGWLGDVSVALFIVYVSSFLFMFTFADYEGHPEYLTMMLESHGGACGLGFAFGLVGVFVAKESRTLAITGTILNALGWVGSQIWRWLLS